jgi:hypothetical protein
LSDSDRLPLSGFARQGSASANSNVRQAIES